jgi:hypothetical protein
LYIYIVASSLECPIPTFPSTRQGPALPNGYADECNAVTDVECNYEEDYFSEILVGKDSKIQEQE